MLRRPIQEIASPDRIENRPVEPRFAQLAIEMEEAAQMVWAAFSFGTVVRVEWCKRSGMVRPILQTASQHPRGRWGLSSDRLEVEATRSK